MNSITFLTSQFDGSLRRTPSRTGKQGQSPSVEESSSGITPDSGPLDPSYNGEDTEYKRLGTTLTRSSRSSSDGQTGTSSSDNVESDELKLLKGNRPFDESTKGGAAPLAHLGSSDEGSQDGKKAQIGSWRTSWKRRLKLSSMAKGITKLVKETLMAIISFLTFGALPTRASLNTDDAVERAHLKTWKELLGLDRGVSTAKGHDTLSRVRPREELSEKVPVLLETSKDTNDFTRDGVLRRRQPSMNSDEDRSRFAFRFHRKTPSGSKLGESTDSDDSSTSRLSVATRSHRNRASFDSTTSITTAQSVKSPAPLQSSVQVALQRKKCLILDLDETLIHSTSKGSRRMKGHTIEVMVGQNIVGYHVYKRPYADYFLRKVSQWYNVVIFTASMQEYADPVIDWLDPERTMISKRFFRQSCTNQAGSYVKNIALVEADLSIVCLVDNSPMSYAMNQANGIPIEGWINDPNDEALLDLLPILDSLRFTSDVRHILGLRVP